MKHSCLKGFTLVELMVVIAIVGILVVIVMPLIIGNSAGGCGTGCGPMPKDEIARAVEKQGYADVEVGECHGWATSYGCSEGDSYACEFRASNAMQQRVSLIACTGYAGSGHGVTIRSP